MRVAVAVGVGALGAWRAWLGAGARVDVYLVRVAGGLWAAGVLLPCVWRFVLSGGVWLVYALCGWCGTWSAWVVSVWVFGGVVSGAGGWGSFGVGWVVVVVVAGLLGGCGGDGQP